MQFTFFHLMPYRPLDMTERHKHRSAWVVLPNTLYDPKKGADEYQSYIDQLVYAAVSYTHLTLPTNREV